MGWAGLALCLYLLESPNGMAQARPPLTSLSSLPPSLSPILLPPFPVPIFHTVILFHPSIHHPCNYRLPIFLLSLLPPSICPPILLSFLSSFLPFFLHSSIHLPTIGHPSNHLSIYLKIFWINKLSIHLVTCFPSIYLSLHHHFSSLFPPSLPPSFPSFHSSISLYDHCLLVMTSVYSIFLLLSTTVYYFLLLSLHLSMYPSTHPPIFPHIQLSILH